MIKKRHYLYDGKESFWEEFEHFLHENYDYCPQETLLVINGDMARWITKCKEHFRKNAYFTLNSYHVAKALGKLLGRHKRYRSIREAWENKDTARLMMELNNAVGTLGSKIEEDRLEELIEQLMRHYVNLGDYRDWLRGKGIDVAAYRPMGSSESMMAVFARRMKQGRAWSVRGAKKVAEMLIGLKDGLEIRTLIGKWEERTTKKVETVRLSKIEGLAVEKSTVGAIRQNIPYLDRATGSPIHAALKGLSKGF